MKVPMPQPTGDLYVDTCFQIDFEEFEEPRRWHEIADMRVIPDMAMIDKRKALALAEAALRQYEDYSFAYYWVAKLSSASARAPCPSPTKSRRTASANCS